MMRYLLALVIFCCTTFSSQKLSAQEWTQSFSDSLTPTYPEWVQPVVDGQDASMLATVSYEIKAPAGSEGLLLHLLFTELEGGFLRIYWKSGDASETLSDNLYEGISMSNQRSLLISKEVMKTGGVLTIQASQQSLKVQRIHWSWLKTVLVLSPEEQEAKLISSLGVPLKLADVSGNDLPVAEDLWRDRVVTAQLTEKAERIEQGVLFEVELAAVPELARIECQINGLPLSQALVLWVNGKRAGLVFPKVPNLSDMGYLKLADGSLSYLGWRNVAAIISPTLLQAGVNQIQFSVGDGEEPLSALALKDLKLQLSYPSEPPAPETVAPPNPDNPPAL